MNFNEGIVTALPPLIRATILDDHALFREGLVRLLDVPGVQVVGNYGDSHQFLRGLPSDTANVALIDLLLTEADGFAVVEQVRNRFPRLPIVIISGDIRPDTVSRCMNLGVMGFLEKLSTTQSLLVEAIRSVASGKGFFPARGLSSLAPLPTARAESHLLRSLTDRERQVLAHIAAGDDNRKLSSVLGISERTVRAHVSNLYKKLGTDNRTQMALLAQQLGVRPVREG